MKFLLYTILFLCLAVPTTAQKKLDKTLKKFNKESVPYIQVEEVERLEDLLLLDARKRDEFEVSHLKNAIWVGHKKFDLDSVVSKIENKNSTIVVYCSIGVRSENIGEKLIKAGYTDVTNLYGGIFEWKNKGYPVFDNTDRETEKVHAFNKHWGKLLTKGEKVYGVGSSIEN